jgi:pimeloyl-ACP methyl ester carboxylesterase
LSGDLKKDGYLIYKKENREFRIPEKYFIERQLIDQEEILSKIKCPVLIIQGAEDDMISIENAYETIRYLSKDSKLEIVKGGSHQLNEKMNIVIPLSVEWLKKYLVSV